MDRFFNVFCFNHETENMACYCPDCVEALCSECACYHTIHNKHRPVPNVFIKFMPAFILQKINRCACHNEKPEFFTSNHSNPCCKTYLKTVHKSCHKNNTNIGYLKHIKLKGKRMFKVNAGDITSSVILPGGRMVFVDNKYDCLIIHDEDGSHNRTIDLLCKPYGITFIKDNKVAVTQASEIIIINLDNDLTEKWIDIGLPCYGVHFSQDKFIVTLGQGNGIQILDIEGNLVNRINVPIHEITDACLHGNELFISAFRYESMLYTLGMANKLKRTLKDKRLTGARQIAIDDNGFWFVVYETSLKVVVFSSDGTLSKVLLCDQDGLHLPKALAYRDNTLLVCNSTSCTALLYDITYSNNSAFCRTKTALFLLCLIVCIICALITVFQK